MALIPQTPVPPLNYCLSTSNPERRDCSGPWDLWRDLAIRISLLFGHEQCMKLGTRWDLRPGHAPASHQPLGWKEAVKDQGQPRSGGVARGWTFYFILRLGPLRCFQQLQLTRAMQHLFLESWEVLHIPWPKAVAKDSAV